MLRGVPSLNCFCNSPDIFICFICLAWDALQEQYELVNSAVLELFKRHMVIIGDEHSGREVMLTLHYFILLHYIIFHMFLAKASQIICRAYV